jgi:methionine-S-sulfoxide reductase
MSHRIALVIALAAVLVAGCLHSDAAEPSAAEAREEVAMKRVTQPPPDGLARATLAGGCFWGMEELIRRQPGVVSTIVGYTGGEVPDATYRHHEGHAEAVEITFDPKKTSYESLLLFFFKMHDPTTLNRQGNDVGTSYRSAIFYHDEEQRRVAEKVKERVEKSGAWGRPIVTEIAPAGPFWIAEDYHQDYLQKHPQGYTCHYIRKIDF